MERKPMQIQNMPVIREIDDPNTTRMIAMGMLQPGTKRLKMGRCRIMLSPPYEDANLGWHLSISCRDRYPSWDEIAHVRYELLPDDVDIVMILPKKEDYIALHDYTFHLHELSEGETIKK